MTIPSATEVRDIVARDITFVEWEEEDRVYIRSQIKVLDLPCYQAQTCISKLQMYRCRDEKLLRKEAHYRIIHMLANMVMEKLKKIAEESVP